MSKEILTSEGSKALCFQIIHILDGLRYTEALSILDEAKQRMSNTSHVVAESAVKDYVYVEPQ